MGISEIIKEIRRRTEKACRQIRIVEEKALSETEREALRRESEAQRREGIRQAEEICRRHRRDGRFFDEIIGGGA